MTVGVCEFLLIVLWMRLSNRGPLALLLQRQYEFPFGINIVRYSIFFFNFFFLTVPDVFIPSLIYFVPDSCRRMADHLLHSGGRLCSWGLGLRSPGIRRSSTVGSHTFRLPAVPGRPWKRLISVSVEQNINVKFVCFYISNSKFEIYWNGNRVNVTCQSLSVCVCVCVCVCVALQRFLGNHGTYRLQIFSVDRH